MKFWIFLMVAYAIYALFFRKPPEVLDDVEEQKEDTMLVTYSPREDSGVQHPQSRELSEGANRLMEMSRKDEHRKKFIEIFGEDFLDKNTEDTPFTDV